MKRGEAFGPADHDRHTLVYNTQRAIFIRIGKRYIVTMIPRSTILAFFLLVFGLALFLFVSRLNRAAEIFRGALYVMDATTPVPNSYYTSAYTYVAFASVEYDTSGLMDKANYQQFIVPAGVSKIRLKCGFVWSTSNPGLRTQMVITKNNLTVPGLNGYRGLTPHNQPDTGGTTTDFGVATHVLPVIRGDTFQCAAWQQQVTEAEISRDIVVASFSMEIVE